MPFYSHSKVKCVKQFEMHHITSWTFVSDHARPIARLTSRVYECSICSLTVVTVCYVCRVTAVWWRRRLPSVS